MYVQIAVKNLMIPRLYLVAFITMNIIRETVNRQVKNEYIGNWYIDNKVRFMTKFFDAKLFKTDQNYADGIGVILMAVVSILLLLVINIGKLLS